MRFHLLCRGQMRDRDTKTGFLGEAFAIPFPQPHPGTVAATAISGDQQCEPAG